MTQFNRTFRYFLLISFLLSLSQGLKAQDFEVAPVRVVFSTTPGESQSRTVTIKNHGNRKETITLQMQDFLVQRDGRMEMLPAGSTSNSISNWINLNPGFLELEPNESRSVQVTLQAPNDEYSSRWGILSFVTTAEQTAFSADRELQTGLSLAGRIDIYLSYIPETDDTGRLEINSLEEIESENPDERVFNVNLDNLGERITSGKVFLVASHLQTGEEHRFRTIDVTTYPQSSRTVELRMPADLAPGTYSVAAILDYPGSASLKGTQITVHVE